MPSIVSRSPARAHAPGPFGCALTLAIATLVAVPAQAEDIDVYRARIAAQQKPNILFVLDYSGSMNQDVNGSYADVPAGERKIDILKEAMAGVLAANEGKIRAGIGSIYASRAGGVRWPISELDAPAESIDPAIVPADTFTARDIMLKQLERQGAGGDTATVDALAEAAMYFRGGAVAHGGRETMHPWNHEPDDWHAVNERYEDGNPRAAIAASYTPASAYWRDVYESGHSGWCSDYSASGGDNWCADKRVIVSSCVDKPAGTWSSTEGGSGSNEAHRVCEYEHPDAWQGASYRSPIEGQCAANAIVLISDGLPDRFLNPETIGEVIGADPSTCENLRAGLFAGASSDVDGDCGPEVVRALANEEQVPGNPGSKVKTYTVGFGVDGVGQDYLDRLAAEGGGASYSADSAESLAEALARAADGIIGENESFVELSVDVDKAAFSHDDRAYFNLFTPSERRGWSGNLKGYFLDADGFRDINGDEAVVTDAAGSRFVDTAQSFWSDAPDGNIVASGGASEQLVAGGRTLYTSLGDAPADLALSAANALAPDNTAIRAADLGTDQASRDAALAWIRTAPMGDPLHSKSVSVDYGDRQVVYVMTNQGLLHAIDATAPSAPGAGDATGGTELFAFMPERLLPNLPILASGETGGEHVYGLDGGTTRWHEDTDGDGVVDDGESVLLVVGMRRGGEAYYALDVSDPLKPALAWTIDSAKAGFGELAQSWSRPSLVSVRKGTGNETQRVLMFGGGYDPALDDEDERVASRGNAVFVVDRNGDLVRKFTHTDMRYAMPADLAVIDSDADGLADRLYAADLGSQVWRIDFDDPADTASSRVTRFADLDGGGYQPFFYPPSIARNAGSTGPWLSVSIGSGDRTDPLDDKSRNAFFMLRDEDVGKGVPESGFTSITADDLYDATDNDLGSDDADEVEKAREKLADARGWLLELDKGEKSLSRVVSFGGELLATTFIPDTSSDDPCAYDPVRRYYRMDIGTAVPREREATDGGTRDALADATTRWRRVEGRGIPSSPTVIFAKSTGADDPGTVQVALGPRIEDRIMPPLSRVYWHAR